MDQGMDEREVILVIDASLDAIYSTLRFFLESQGSTFDGENGLILSNAFMRLKTDLHDAMRFYPAGTATVQAL